MRRTLSITLIVLFLPGLLLLLGIMIGYLAIFSRIYRLASGPTPSWDNCAFWAIREWLTDLRRDWPSRKTEDLPPGGFLTLCVSCYGPFLHFIHNNRAYVPKAPHRNRWFPPLVFDGEVREGPYLRET
jgi:hypothetical protein